MQVFKDSFKIIITSFIISLSVYVVFAAWTDPTAAPPGNNIDIPLNIGSNGQSKAGGLILNTGGATNGLIVQSGNVGIGLTDPVAKLYVKGIGGVPSVTGAIISGGNEVIVARGAEVNALVIGAYQSSPYAVWLQGQDVNDRSSFRSIILNPAGGNVGIGTVNPGQRLEVAGGLKVTGEAGSPPAANTITKENIVKAWVNFQGTFCTGGTGTGCTIRSSHNVSSVTRNATGIYTITWNTAFADVNYVVTGSCQRVDAPASIMFQIGRGQITYPFSTNTAVIGCGNYDGIAIDGGVVTVMAIGNQ